jgi:acyl dehydratase
VSSIESLGALLGQEIGVGDWLEVDADRVALFEQAVGGPHDGLVPPLLLLSLIPHLLSGIRWPIANPSATINYGLERSECGVAVAIGDRVRARVSLAGIERIGGSVQVRRSVTVETETGQTALRAETVTRLVY